MTGPGGFADLEPSQAELDAVLDVLAEVDAGELPPDDYGPWDDEAGLAQLADIGGRLDMAGATEAQRLAENVTDQLDRRPSLDAKIARGFRRIEAGTYTPGQMYREPEPGYGCGIYSELDGRCAARYHDAGCLEVLRGAAATGDAEAALEWRATLNRNQAAASALQLANQTGMDWDEQLGSQPNDLETLDAMRALLGIGGQELPQPVQPARADVGTLRADLGLY